jgi:hypothetical protein
VAAGMGGGEPLTLRLSLKNDLGSTIGNAVDINFGGGPTITQDYTFNFNQILNISGTTIVVFQIDIIDSMFGMAQIRQITSRAQNDINYKFQGVFKNCLYNGTNDKTTLAYNQMQLYSILLPLPSNSYDTSEFTVYSKLQLEPFFIQTGTGSTSGNSFSLYCGDNTLSHFHTSINLGGGAGSIPTLAQIMNNDVVALGAPYLVNATRATQHLDMNAKTIYNASIDGYNIKSLIAGNNITLTGGSGTYTISSTGSHPTQVIPSVVGQYYTLNNVDLQNYDYYLNFEVTNAWYNYTTLISFNGTQNNPYNYQFHAYPTTSNTGNITNNTYAVGAQMADAGSPPIFICPNYGSFFLANCNMTYKMSGLRQNVTLLQQIGEPVWTHGEGGGYYGGKGTSNQLANWVGCDNRSIFGIYNIRSIRLYLPDNNATWGPTSIRLISGDNIGHLNIRLNVSRQSKNI